MSLVGKDKDTTLAGRLVDQLTEAILSGELEPGAHISEPKLAKQLGVSRGPLREATRRLEERMLVTHTPRQGVRVATLSQSVMAELFTIREAIEGMAAREAARNLSDAQADELRRLIARHEETLARTEGSDYEPANADQDFHVAIAGYSGNSLIFNMLTREYYPLMRLFRSRHRWVEGRAMRALVEHKRIVDAVVERDADLAELLMRRHIAAARKSVATLLDGASAASADSGAGRGKPR